MLLRPADLDRSRMIWLQVRDVRAEHDRLTAAGVRIVRGPVREPWGLASPRPEMTRR
jgi:predicted enzyme related to lactoylglutathione lyase